MTKNITKDTNLEQQGAVLWEKCHAHAPPNDRFWDSYQALITEARNQQQSRSPPPSSLSAFTIHIPEHFPGQFTTDISQWKDKLIRRLKSLATTLSIVIGASLVLEIDGHITAPLVIGSLLVLSTRYMIDFFNAKQLMIEITPQQIIRYHKNMQHSKEIGKVEFQKIGSLKEDKNNLIVFTEGLTSGLEHNFEKNVVRIPKNLEKYREIKSFLEQVRVWSTIDS